MHYKCSRSPLYSDNVEDGARIFPHIPGVKIKEKRGQLKQNVYYLLYKTRKLIKTEKNIAE